MTNANPTTYPEQLSRDVATWASAVHQVTTPPADYSFSPQIGELAASLSKFQAACGNVAKGRTNPHLKNRYSTLVDAWDTIRPQLGESGLAVIQLPLREENRAGALTRLAHSSGQWAQCRLLLPWPSNKGVNAAQAIGSAISYARRYSLMAVLGLASGDDDDGHGAGPQRGRRTRNQPPEDTRPLEPGTVGEIAEAARAVFGDAEDFPAWLEHNEGVREPARLNRTQASNVLAWLRDKAAELRQRDAGQAPIAPAS